MNRVSTTQDGWHPQTQQDRDAVLRELHRVLASSQFCNSKRYPALLKYIVENTLAGKSDLLKERTLGVEVFERPATYDTNADTVVRYTAGEVRKRLLYYYHEEGKDSEIRIFLPAGSYIPEFLHEQGNAHEAEAKEGSESGHRQAIEGVGPSELTVSPFPYQAGIGDGIFRPSPEITRSFPIARTSAIFIVLPWALVAVFVLAGAVAGFMWRARNVHPQTSVDEFWVPVLRDQRTTVICTGSLLFAQNKYSGVFTSGTNGDVEYPFVSMQIAGAIAQIEEALESSGVKTQLLAAPWSTLTDLREHSVTLIGAYNNQWTMRLTEPLRYHFAPDPANIIVDGQHPQTVWERDQSVPYSSADDYALVARFRDPTIDGWVVVLGGLGRNGTEAAAQFVTSPHYMDILEQQLGTRFGNRNIEVVLKVSVVEGKTGAPSILAIHTW